MTMPLVADPQHIRLGLAGRVRDNDHPYSWAAIVNGYEPEAMAAYADPVITAYLAEQPPGAVGLAGVRVTHLWCEDAQNARQIALAGRIPTVVDRPRDLIGAVDAVLIPTDIGGEHLERARPFVEAGLPVFVDKPLTDRADHLAQFERWVAEGRAIASSSALRYALEFEDARRRLDEVGQLRAVTCTMPKGWLRYGVHALEAVYPFLRPGGWQSVRDSGAGDAHIVHARHADGVDAVLMVIDDLLGAAGCVELYGTQGRLSARFGDRFGAFKRQLMGFIAYLRTGEPAVPFEQTAEVIRLLIGADHSRREGGRVVALDEVSAGLADAAASSS